MNVGMSRAEEFVILIASRSEMQSPYLKPLLSSLRPMVLNRAGSVWRWSEVSSKTTYSVPPAVRIRSQPPRASDHAAQVVAAGTELRPAAALRVRRWTASPALSGAWRVAARRSFWVIGSARHLIASPTSPTPGSGRSSPITPCGSSLSETIESAWREDKGDQPFPWQRVEILHVSDLLNLLLHEVGMNMKSFGFDYDSAAEAYLKAMSGKTIKPRCHALFADEGQDLGPNTLKLLTALVEHGDPEDPKSRSVNIFYDNAQNIYDRRGVPKWSEMGLDMRGRSTVMKESFRSTKPITEFSFNVLHRLNADEAKRHRPEGADRDGARRSRASEAGIPWWELRFTQTDGPTPTFEKFAQMEDEYEAIGNQIIHWVKDEGVKPSDICIIFLGKQPARRLESQVKKMLRDHRRGPPGPEEPRLRLR